MCRIERLEFLDEKELLIQLLQHYCVSCGYTDTRSIGESSAWVQCLAFLHSINRYPSFLQV